MTTFDSLLAGATVASPLPFDLNAERGIQLDLSEHNRALDGFDPGDTAAFSAFIEGEISRFDARYAAGGYAENRTLYAMSSVFGTGETEPRTLHLGIDLWLAAGTPIHAVLGGVVHSTQDNAAFGDYGPTLILEHALEGERFFTLYGHLAQPTLQRTRPGQRIETGELLGWLGAPHENVGWPPHLHFQLMRELGGRSGDYPGVARPSEASQWLTNCPDPNLLLRIRALG
ncbi:MAG: peptidoglycan DD-metalloendopeptidase family protein [Pseudomonadota bacterium]